jgi:BirA family biotin operon repressor/biotin-[acetyl-CoA-carboxylase] ligase
MTDADAANRPAAAGVSGPIGAAGKADARHAAENAGTARPENPAARAGALIYLPEVDSTNAWAKRYFAAFSGVGAVYSTCQTAGRGRLGRAWVNAAGQALYYTCAVRLPLTRFETLPLLASLVVRDALDAQFGAGCQIKWPNDLLLNGKKLVGILCEGLPDRGGAVIGIGVNLAQPQRYFAAAGLPNGTSLALQGFAVTPADTGALASALTHGFAAALPAFARDGFAALRAPYRAACVNLGRHVNWDGGSGTAMDVDEAGRLVVREDSSGEARLFTGEVSVHGIYGAV